MEILMKISQNTQKRSILLCKSFRDSGRFNKHYKKKVVQTPAPNSV